MDYVKYRPIKNDLGDDVVVHVEYEKHRLVYPDHHLVTIDLGEDVVVHVNYVKYSAWSRMTLERTQ